MCLLLQEIDNAAKPDECFHRYLYTRVLLLRPLLLVATKRRSTVDASALKPTSLDADIVKSCCNLCIKTAQYLIECLHQHLDTTYRSSGWHSVYCKQASQPAFSVSAVKQNSQPPHDLHLD